jgi:hypothetical protein
MNDYCEGANLTVGCYGANLPKRWSALKMLGFPILIFPKSGCAGFSK